MRTVFFRNATILDTVAGALIPDQSILIRDRTIESVGTEVDAPPDASVVDAAGRVLMPGLCDAHVHVIASTADFAALERLPASYVVAQSSRILRDMLMRGFTTVRDAGGADYGIARALQEGLIAGPRLLYCGKAISQTGGHGDMRSAGELTEPQCFCCAGLGRICDGVTEMRRACRDAIRQGATHIKLMMSGGVSSPTDRITSTQFADEEIAAAVEEANAAEIYCMAHAYTPRAIQRAVRAGVRSIEHGNLLDQPTAELIREKGAYLVPTLVTYDALARDGLQAGLAPSMAAKLKDVLDRGLAAFEIAVKSNVNIAFGTDLLGSMHRHQLEEFTIRSSVQKPVDVIRSATVNAARLFKMEGQIGVIAPGAQADLLLLKDNPLESLRILAEPDRYLDLIMQNGNVVYSRA